MPSDLKTETLEQLAYDLCAAEGGSEQACSREEARQADKYRDEVLAELHRRDEQRAAVARLVEAAGLVVGMAAVWQHDPDKSPNTMNVGVKELSDALAPFQEPTDA